MNILKNLVPEQFRASDEEIEVRNKICGGCEFRVSHTGSCGTLIIGTSVLVNGKWIKLCGCITNEKSVLADSECDLKKWLKYERK